MHAIGRHCSAPLRIKLAYDGPFSSLPLGGHGHQLHSPDNHSGQGQELYICLCRPSILPHTIFQHAGL